MIDFSFAMILRAMLMVLFLVVFVQDMKDRSVHVALLVGLFLTVCAFRYVAMADRLSLMVNTAINLLFVGVQLCLLSVYIVLRFRGTVSSILNYIGLGDILFWVAICPLVNFPDFIVHFVASLFLALMLHVVLCRFSFYSGKSVPLAGMQGIYYCISLLFPTYLLR